MTARLYDTSALTKHYQTEPGSAMVDGLLAAPGRQVITRLAVVEAYSAFAKSARIGRVSAGECDRLCRRLQRDVDARQFEVVRVLVRHFQAAERLVRRLGPTQNLRTLDALQLAVALDLDRPGQPVTFVSADQALCLIAAGEGVAVVNPESP